MDLLPSYGGEIELVASRQASISKDSARIAFVYVPDVHNPPVFLYVGYLEEPGGTDGGPVIDEVYLSAPAIAAGNPGTGVDVDAEVSHINGQGSIVAATVDQLSDGALLSSIEAPLAFPEPSLRNDGEDPDTVAGDKIWSGVAGPSSRIGDFADVTLRVAAMDDNRAVAIRDRVLRIE
jgi:hypothetical protein